MEIKNRYEFTVLFDVENGNPNGDPDMGNMPRTDPEKNHGIVTDVCLKRKIRNYIDLYMEDEVGYKILIKTDKAINDKIAEAYNAAGNETEKKKGKKCDKDDAKRTRDYMCKEYFDVRAFGGVLNTGDNPCGTVTGPVQLSFAKSVDPVLPTEITITRQAVTKTFDMDKKDNEMGKKCYIPYGLYRADGYISAGLAKKTGLSEDDLELLWSAIINMFEHDHSAARGKMAVRKLYIFKHDSYLGNAPSAVLFDKIEVKKRMDVDVARSFKDYEITVDTDIPSGVELIEKF